LLRSGNTVNLIDVMWVEAIHICAAPTSPKDRNMTMFRIQHRWFRLAAAAAQSGTVDPRQRPDPHLDGCA
jgi:hypothetical protein